ncbi:putative transcriptional regulator yfgA cro/C1-type DNA-binding domain [Cupriavidus taiwanensis]|uniref:Putative transcriptional regulator yfgA cro/C1-type DNA-binding domain n=1 Tax=Cupriavidus taiwanensis TaxID=164546 RepID=A0A375GVE7_9BURK|nr:RodZ domain-containing protein [Cupriavidus taiwanensis]SOY43322.1 putative transcriptional regulator yfgA; cro/C1-type DNA-binding domain [Cupriavidus taiwanensis]SOY45801.1 putative transcriptional regulator yfgA; cro/C1-type DNA-binding domain [Cupriavidus taiwanensis]SOY81259.1 putative transcriptional regulator yfgA; cro/C1-type DNA-binding domain [Cupriavidus taiwanensis]SOZ54117.1 putative transcriptional regulator yfgA; cro/C1-type DNA-binding domain [Cupriavidus taiwanensis]SOZ7780
MSEHDRAAGQAVPTQAVGGGAHEGEREAAAREIGAALAREREAQRMSVEDVSARLKVAASKLRAIEAADLQALPDVTFAKGVMRAYARMLHVDIDPLLARFQPRAVAQVAEIARQREGGINAAFDDRNRFRSGGNGGRWVWLALVAVVVAAGLWFGLDHIRAWIDARSSAPEAVAAEAPAAENAGAEAGIVTAALPPVMAASDSPAPSAETVPASAAAASATAAAPAAAAATAAPAAAAPAAPTASAAAVGEGELQIRFASDTWFEIRDNSGKVVMGGTAKAGQAMAGGGTAPYRVVIGNVKGVEAFTRGGTPVDLKAASRNNVARLTLP